MIKIIIAIILRCCLSIFKIFPINKHKIFFISYAGKQFSCNPKAIYEFIKSKDSSYTFVWAIDDFSKINDDVIKVKPNSFKYFYHLITSKFLITNNGFSCWIPKKRSSLWIDTWHGGGAFKRIDWNENLYSIWAKKTRAKQIDYYVSSSLKFTDVQSSSTLVDRNKFVPIGMPRNDIFFNKEKIKQGKLKVQEYFNLEKDSFIVLFAPTYRGVIESSGYDFRFDYEYLLKKIKILTGKNTVFLFRCHHAMLRDISFVSNKKNLDASSYPDMQDLLCAADLLITDYSSSIWDWSLLKKPCVLYTPDLMDYEIKRGFYTPISEWPYPFYITNEDLCDNLTLDVDYKKIDKYHDQMGSYETGHACKKLWSLIRNAK